MFCQQCGNPLSQKSQRCEHCGHEHEVSRISNKAMLMAIIAAAISSLSLLIPFPKTETDTSQPPSTPTPIIAARSPTPTPLSRQSPKPITPLTPTPRPTKSTLDYLHRHTPTLIEPSDGAVISYRFSVDRLRLRWAAIAGSEADQYKVGIIYGDPARYREFETPWTYYTVEFERGLSPPFSGRWRVTPILADGKFGIPTEWRRFYFVR